MRQLLFDYIVRVERNIKSKSDRRKRVDWILASYVEPESGYEYRKSYEYPKGTGIKAMRIGIPRIIEEVIK